MNIFPVQRFNVTEVLDSRGDWFPRKSILIKRTPSAFRLILSLLEYNAKLPRLATSPERILYTEMFLSALDMPPSPQGGHACKKHAKKRRKCKHVLLIKVCLQANNEVYKHVRMETWIMEDISVNPECAPFHSYFLGFKTQSLKG
jgi:hypothetical protein